jgi:hypothetical protein
VKKSALVFVAASLCGCNLIDSHGVHYDYAFDAQRFTENVGNASAPATLPTMMCDPAITPDPCSTAAPAEPNVSLHCESSSHTCIAVADVSAKQTIDLTKAQNPLPDNAVRFGISAATIKKVAYWVANNTLNVATPPIQIFVAPEAAKDQNDPDARLLGTVAPLPARSRTCADTHDGDGDPAAPSGSPVCDVSLNSDGATQLESYVANYKTPFQVIVHATVTAHGGDPIPSGMIDFSVRPTATIGITQ